MDSKRWELIQQLFHQVIELPETQRVALLNSHAECDTDIKKEILSLLQAENDANTRSSVQDQISKLLTDSPIPTVDISANYDIQEKIASGGMGSVFKAWDKRLSRTVAIKLLHPHRSQQQRAKTRFLREARATAKIQHDNICPIYEVSETKDGVLYLVSGFCHGENLSEKIANRQLNFSQIIAVFEQLLAALSLAHTHGLVHRDLKPDNIIVDDDNRIQLVDFGIARNFDDYQTETGDVIGTPDYMSPEQFRGEAFDHLSDIWSCGIILYELLEGTTPYAGKTAPEIVYSMLHEPIQLQNRASDQLASLYQLIQQCLQIDKNLRPLSADILRSSLEAARSDLIQQELLDSKPDYAANLDSRNQSTRNTSFHQSLAVQRNVVSLKLKVYGENIDPVHFDSLRKLLQSRCLKFRGVVSSTIIDTKTAKKPSLKISTIFGYPIADELKIHNAVSCGFEWQSLLHDAGLQGCILATSEKLVEDDNQFISDFSLLEQQWSSEWIMENFSDAGFWLLDQLLRGLKQGVVSISESKMLSVKDKQLTCHSITNLKTNEVDTQQNFHSTFVGRESQLAFLLENWEQAVEGELQRILISGEAGIGKSRLIYEFKSQISLDDDFQLLELNCSPYEKGTTYYPVLQFLRKEISARINNKGSVSTENIIEYFKEKNEYTENDKLLFCKLMNIELSPDEMAKLPSGDMLSRQYQNLLLRLLTSKPGTTTSLMIIEDLHWADTATGALIERLLQPTSSQKSMILLSSRPEYRPSWLANLVTNNIYLNKLLKKHSENLVKNTLQKTGFLNQQQMLDDSVASLDSADLNPAEIIAQLVERTDGNPLFIEELSRSISKQSLVKSSGGLKIPKTIEDTLIERLSRLGVSQTMAQIASIIGRDFNLELLRACYAESETEFNQQLQTLINAGIFRHLENNNYRFKHALIRDAAYQMLVPETRYNYHRLVAEKLEECFDDIVNAQPELMAQHWQLAQDSETAISYWIIAAKRNLQLSATTECLLQCEHIILLAGSLENESAANFNEYLLATYLIQGPALMMKRGYADERMKESYSKALELIEKTNNRGLEFPALFGLWTYHCVKAQHQSAAKLAQKMVALSAKLSSFEKCEAHMVTGITQYYRGQFTAAQKELSIAFDNYEKQQTQQHILTFGQDPGVVIQSYQAWNESMLGNMLDATTYSTLAVENARLLNHPFTLTYALSFAGWFQLNGGQIETAERLIDESIDVCETNDIAVFLGLSLSLKALVLFSKGEVEQGTALMENAEKIYLGTGATLFVPGFMTAKAEVSLVLQDIATAEQLLDQALTLIDASDETWCLALTLGLRSVVYASRGQEEQEQALLVKASNVLAQQNALGFKKLLEEERGLDLDV